MALGCFAAVGDSFTVDNVTYSVTADNEVAVSGAAASVTSLVVNASVSYNDVTYTVSAVADHAFKYSKITSLTLPNTVKSIGYQSFYNLPNLTELNLGNGLKTIGDFAFGYLGAQSVTLPEGLESIGNSAFFCAKTTDITFPSTLREIGPSCFYKAPITKAILPEALETLGKKAFLECTQLAEVRLPNQLTVIGDGTFFKTAITQISLPTALETIGEEAFYESKLTSIFIPASVTSIAGGAFSGTNIAEYVVDAANQTFTTVDGILYNADKSIVVSMAPKSSITELTLPESCIGIGASAFYGSGIKKLTVGSKLRAIDGFAFCLSQLSSINMPESLVYIGEQAFAGTKLTEVVLPKSLPQLPQAVFAECRELTTVTIPAALTYIDIREFFNCTSLATVNCLGMTPPELEAVYESGEEQFFNCPSTMVLNVPIGAKAAYKSSDWKNYFGDRIYETHPAALMHTELQPASGAQLASFDGVTVSYPEPVSIVLSHPDIKVVEGSLVAGVPVGNVISVDDWYAQIKPDNKVMIFPADYDGYTSPIRMEKDKNYYICIPAGIVKNAAGALNEAFIIEYKGSYEAPRIVIESITPPNDATNLGVLETIAFTFSESVTLKDSKLSSIKICSGSPDGNAVAVDQWWALNGVKVGTAISIFAGDYDGYTCPVVLAPNTDYYVNIPAGLFALTSSLSTINDAIVLHYRNESTDLTVLSAPQEQIYTLQGLKIDKPQPGQLYIMLKNGQARKFIAR